MQIKLDKIREIFKRQTQLLKMVIADYKKLFFGLFLVSFLVSLLPFLTSFLLGQIINILTSENLNVLAGNFTIFVIIFYVFSLIATPVLFKTWFYLGKIFWFVLEEKFEMLIYQKRSSLDIAHLENPEKQDLINKVREQSWRVRNFIDRIIPISNSFFEVSIAFIIILVAKWWFLPIVIIAILPELIIELRKGETVWSIHTDKSENRRTYWELTGHLTNRDSLIELKLFQNQRHFLQSISKLFKSFQNEHIKNESKAFKQNLVAVIFNQCVIAGLVIYLLFQAINGEIQVGTMTFLIGSIYSFSNSFAGLINNLARHYEDGLFIIDVFIFLELPDIIAKSHKPIELPDFMTPKIEFVNVSFSYPGTDKKVIENLNLTINPGEKVALIGINGAGKTTLVKLLCRFYDPTDGKILINGIDLKNIDLENWYQKIAVLFQSYSNYHFITKEMISLGDTNKITNNDKIINSAMAAEAHEFIEAWNKKYDQMLGNEFTDGIEPSIGQWQKLALARSFYRDPKIMILDEPTSAIDAEAEAKIFERLDNLSKDKTVIFISHRFSTVRKADKIIVMESSKLKEMGTHAELLAQNGTYAKLFALQAKGYE